MGALTESHVVVLAFAAGAGQKVLVKVGGAPYATFVNDRIMGLDRMGVLRALKNDEGFAASLMDVALNGCDVFVGGFVGYSPTVEEEDAATALEGFMTISTPPRTAPQVFIRVNLPRECRRVAACGLTPPPRHALTDESLRGV